jgi:hypothetical protein
MAAFMFGAIISGEVGTAKKSTTDGQIGIVEGAAQDVDTSSMIEQTVSTFPGSAVVPTIGAHVSIRV